MTELEELIRAQAADLRQGPRQMSEPLVSFSLDADPIFLEKLVDDRGQLRPIAVDLYRCAVHGNEDTYLSSSGVPVCRVCRRSRQARWKRRRRPWLRPKNLAYVRDWKRRQKRVSL